LFAEEGLKEHFEMVIDELAAPFAATGGRQQLVADKLLIRFALEFVNGDINCATTTVENHDDGALDHLMLQLVLSVVSALDGGAFGLEAEKKVGTAELIDNASFESSPAHELFLIFRPQRRHSQHPANLVFLYLAHLLGQLLNGLVRDEPERLRDHKHKVKLAPVDRASVLVHSQKVHFILLK